MTSFIAARKSIIYYCSSLGVGYRVHFDGNFSIIFSVEFHQGCDILNLIGPTFSISLLGLPLPLSTIVSVFQ